MRFAFPSTFSALLQRTLKAALQAAALAAMLMAASGQVAAAVIHVSIDTSKFAAATGYIDMQFGASTGGPLETATVTNMTGFDSSAYIDSWGLTPVTGGYQFRNDTSNDLFHAVNFGATLAFDLTFAGAFDASSLFVSAFKVSAFDEAFAPLGAYDPVSGALATFLWTPPVAAGVSGVLAFNVSDPDVSVVPEPATLALFGFGMAGLALVRRRTGARSNPMGYGATGLMAA